MAGSTNFGAGGEFLKLIGDWWVLTTDNVVLTMKTGILAILKYLTGMDINNNRYNLIVKRKKHINKFLFRVILVILFKECCVC